MIGKKIERKLTEAFQLTYLIVENESHQHHVPVGSESHFKVVIVSEYFVNMKVLARHRSVYAVLAEELAHDIHALALHTYTPEEWQKRPPISMSPPCHGRGKVT